MSANLDDITLCLNKSRKITKSDVSGYERLTNWVSSNSMTKKYDVLWKY